MISFGKDEGGESENRGQLVDLEGVCGIPALDATPFALWETSMPFEEMKMDLEELRMAFEERRCQRH